MSNRPRARKPPPKPAGRQLPVVPIVVAVAIVAVAIAAVLITQLGGDDDTSVTQPSVTQPTPGSSKEIQQTGALEVSGTPLPVFDSAGTDSAIGMTAPTLRGTSFDGTPVTVEPGTAPMLVLFAAHWCPHCQQEIPRLAGPFQNLPAGTKVVTVSTAAFSNRPNYPPSAWFEKENWPTPVLADDGKGTAANAYGLRSFPYFVYIDKSGKVVERADGAQGADKVLARLRSLAAT